MKIAVYGSANGIITEEVKIKARTVGREIARRGHILITGACPGIPHEAVLGCKEFNGKNIGFTPATDAESHLRIENIPQEFFSELIFVPTNYLHAKDIDICRKYRNIFSVAACDAAIFIGGRTGALNEFTIAYDLGKNIGVLEHTGGISERTIRVLLSDIDKNTGSNVIFETNPLKLIDKITAI